jgi:hypothetical protein
MINMTDRRQYRRSLVLRSSIGNNSEKLMQKYRLWLAAKADLAARERDSSRKS